MPELPEVETVRRMLEATIRGRTIETVRLSGLPLRSPISRTLPRRLEGRRFVAARRHGKYLLLDLDENLTLLSHLGMSGRWLFHPRPPAGDLPHVHARFGFTDGSLLWFQDPRRFGLLRLVSTRRLSSDPSLSVLGSDPVAEPPTGASLKAMARGVRVNMKCFLLDQKRLAGIGNIYASEILHRAGVHPGARAGRVSAERWAAIADATRAVLGEAIAAAGTTFSMYRTLWNEPGAYGEQLRVYDRAGEPCLGCGAVILRTVQAARSTFHCPRCQPARGSRRGPEATPKAGNSRSSRARNRRRA